jgi:hypothetical protein
MTTGCVQVAGYRLHYEALFGRATEVAIRISVSDVIQCRVVVHALQRLLMLSAICPTFGTDCEHATSNPRCTWECASLTVAV